MSGPFYDLTREQWDRVKENHRRFTESKDLGRPLIFGLWARPDASGTDEDEEIVLAGPKRRDPVADADILGCVRAAKAMSRSDRLRDSFPALALTRNLYGHSQRLAEPFGAEPFMDAGHCQSRPGITSMSQVARLKPRAVSECHWLSRSLEVLRYYYESTEGNYPVREMVTTGPIDTVNYITGTTLLLESLYTHPKEVHALLDMVTDVLIDHILECRRIVGGRLVPDHTPLLAGYTLCSELRSEYSGEHYEEFEAPYLRRIGEAVGPLIIHASGRWEQSLPATLADPNIFHIVIWVRDTDLATVTGAIGDRISVEAWRSDLQRYGFPDSLSYYRYLLAGLRPETRFTIAHPDPEAWNQAWDEMDRQASMPPQVRAFGRM